MREKGCGTDGHTDPEGNLSVPIRSQLSSVKGM